ncbi:hypothetical protein DYY67_1092 [Candidatus Nitrosotalea sp. TS]|nr:hypothetical protein [Candidatus Nitrosotalea sp. TS]
MQKSEFASLKNLCLVIVVLFFANFVSAYATYDSPTPPRAKSFQSIACPV